MKSVAKFIILHSSGHKGGGGGAYRAFVTVVVLFSILTFTFTLALTLISTATGDAAVPKSDHLPQPIAKVLLHYAFANTTQGSRMSAAEIESIASILRRCDTPCNLLIFGLSYETLLWITLNQGGRTVLVDENAFILSKFAQKYPSIEAYDVKFATKVRELHNLIERFKVQIDSECRAVQNLLFSDCDLAVNELPNHVYDIAWDVIVIDGPAGYSPDSPGRMATIFSSGVMARTRSGGGGTHVFVHEIEREVERVCSDLFLCRQNLVEKIDKLGHFIVARVGRTGNSFGFCSTPHSSLQ